MGRRGGAFSRAIAREVSRSIRQAARNAERAAAQQRRMQAQYAKAAARQAKQQYLEDRIEYASDLNAELDARIAELRNVLPHTLSVNDTISFNLLRVKEDYPPFRLTPELTSPLSRPHSLEAYLSAVKEPSWFGRLLPRAKERHEQALDEARRRHESDINAYQKEEARRNTEKVRLEGEYNKARAKALTEARQRNTEVAQLEADYRAGETEAVETYNAMVLERSEYPDGFPQNFDLSYRPTEKELLIEYESPSVDIIPAIGEYKYVKTRDAVDEKPRKQTEIKELYSDVIAAVALRTLHEVFEADQHDHIKVAVFNGYAQGIDPTTGRHVRSCLIAVGINKANFNSFNLRRIDKQACLRSIKARISSRPIDLLGITPLTSADEAISQPTPTSRRTVSARNVKAPPLTQQQPTSTVQVSISDVPRQQLIQIIAQRGQAVCENARLCQGLLRDMCGEHRREIHVLIRALDERVAADLLQSSQSMPVAVLLSRLSKRLQDNQGIAEEFARWAVESCAIALGIMAADSSSKV